MLPVGRAFISRTRIQAADIRLDATEAHGLAHQDDGVTTNW
jgi:hypothetical protein